MFMTHPTVEGVATATESAFEAIWKPKGWVEADPKVIAEAERAELASALGIDVEAVPTPTAPARSAPKGAWVDWAVLQGADRSAVEAMTRDELVGAYGPTGEGA